MKRQINKTWQVMCVEKFAFVAAGSYISWVLYLAQAYLFKQSFVESNPIWQLFFWLPAYLVLVIMWLALGVTAVLFVEAIISLFTRENQVDLFEPDNKNKEL